jgi:Mrp family chromosome partitioning ATPase
MSDRVYEETRWNGGTGVIRRLQVAGHHVIRILVGWLDSVRERLAEDVGLHAGAPTARGLRGGVEAGVEAATQERRGARARVDLEELIRQEEIKLVQQVFLASGLEARRAVLFAGVQGDNGCARICIRASQRLARLVPQSVCVVDANLRAPALHEVFGRANDDGLVAAIAQPEAGHTFAQRLEPENLWLLPSGSSSASNRDLLLTADRVRPCLRELSTWFDRVVVNAPPINLYAESLALSQFMDGVVLVLEANVTRREIVRSVKNRLEDLNVPLLGIVLNDRTFPIPEAVYRLL